MLWPQSLETEIIIICSCYAPYRDYETILNEGICHSGNTLYNALYSQGDYVVWGDLWVWWGV